MGVAASMGTIIASSGAKGKTLHAAKCGIFDSPAMGGAGSGTQQTDMAIVAEHLLRTRNTLEKNLGRKLWQVR